MKNIIKFLDGLRQMWFLTGIFSIPVGYVMAYHDPDAAYVYTFLGKCFASIILLELVCFITADFLWPKVWGFWIRRS